MRGLENAISHSRGLMGAVASIIGRFLLNPFTYLALYLAVIFGFAGLYDARKDAIFYAPYAKLEPSSQKDYSAVESNIFKAIHDTNPFPRVDDTGWILNPDNLDVTNLALDGNGDFSFTLRFFATHFTHDREDVSLGGPVENIKIGHSRVFIPNSDQVCRLVSLPPDTTGQTVLKGLFKQSTLAVPTLCWDGRADYQFDEMRAGWAGNPKAFSGSYWRMLYLSSVTITSVGYGDIVPISNTARLLCGLEAVLGWVIAGFFLGVIAIRRR